MFDTIHERGLYVDDPIMAAKSNATVDDIITKLRTKYPLKDQGPITSLLNVSIKLTDLQPKNREMIGCLLYLTIKTSPDKYIVQRY